MDVYFDSGLILKLYVQEANSPQAIALIGAERAPPWQEIEVKTAMRLKVFRGEISANDLQLSLGAFEEDIRLGRWQIPLYDQGRFWQLLHEISARHTVSVGCRTLDLIHIAMALTLRARVFFSFDLRQKEVARLEGLNVKP